MSDQAIVPELQAVEWSLRCPVVIVFAKTRVSGYENALAAARRAERYAEKGIGSKLLHIAGFGHSSEQLAFALYAIENLRRSSTLLVCSGGKRIQDNWRIGQVLECIVTANSCGDTRAHCTVIVPEERLEASTSLPTSISIRIPESPDLPDTFGLWRIGAREFPCRYMFEHGFKFQKGHPSSETDQIQAGAVRAGCDWCPHLRRNPLALPVK